MPYYNKRKYKQFCVNCGKEARASKVDRTKPIDWCRECINEIKKVKIKEIRE